MKKLMIAAAAIAFGMVARAAQVDWYIDVYDAGFTSTQLSNFTLYVFNSGSDAASLASLLTSGNYEDASNFNSALSSATKATTSFDTEWAFASGTTLNVGDYISALFLTDTEKGSMVYYTDALPTAGLVYEQGQQQPGQLEAYYDSFSAGAVSYKDAPGPTPVPEPTSGLMLLLGMGALALRRRRA